MDTEEFERLVTEEFRRAVPERFLRAIENVAVLIEDVPSEEIRKAEGLAGEETLLGLYQGVSVDRRGGEYGIGPTLPDTITLYRVPILEEAEDMGGGEEAVRRVIRETVWHEVAHYFGFDEHEVHEREEKGENFSV
jgi:predicted Zn-dependent protease with MMP-like domain